MTEAASWHAALHRLQQTGVAHVLATQVSTAGSTPREPGARMVITEHEVFDTLGGGTFEWQTIEAAREYLAHRQTGFHLEAFSLGGRSGQCCGGFVNIMLEVFAGAPTHLAVFGAGHVGQEVVALSAPLPWQRLWFDSRDAFPTTVRFDQPRLARARLGNIAVCVKKLPAYTHALILTHSHDEDYALIEALLMREDVSTIGLIGSASKWLSFKSRLERAGYDASQIDRVRCPIGALNTTKLDNKTPYAIALTAVTELLWLTNKDDHSPTRGLDSASLRPLFNDSTS